jgi:hypothetical protein
MAPAVAPVRSLPPGSVFKPSGHQIIAQYLAPKVLRGDTTTLPGLVAEGVDVFSAANPATLPFHPSSRREHGEAWGYFYGEYPAGEVRQVPGGFWARYGPEKGYVHGHRGAMEAIAFRRRFAFHLTWRDDDGGVVMVPTPWLMKEYRLNKGAAVFRAAAARPGPKANMDCVVRKIFANPPPCSSDEEFPAYRYPGGADEDAGNASDDDLKRVGFRLEEEPARKRAR